MTTKEKEIVEGLLACDEKITKRFFYTECRPFFNGVIHHMFRNNAEYDEIINDFLLFLLTPGTKTKIAPLRKFGTNSPEIVDSDTTYALIEWIKTTATNYFRHIAKNEQSIASRRKVVIDEDGEQIDVDVADTDNEEPGTKIDADFYFNSIKNERDKEVLKKYFFEGKNADAISKELGISKDALYVIKNRALARIQQVARHASSDDSLCSVICEQFILDVFGNYISIDNLKILSENEGWLTKTGVRLEDIGKVCQHYGLSIFQKSEGSLEDVRNSLNNGHQIIAAVDGGELIGNQVEESIEDCLFGQISDHCVVVLAVNDDIVTLLDPAFGLLFVAKPHFLDAWQDSKRFYVEVSK